MLQFYKSEIYVVHDNSVKGNLPLRSFSIKKKLVSVPELLFLHLQHLLVEDRVKKANIQD